MIGIIILKILSILLIIIMSIRFILDIIKYFKEKKYWKVALGLFIIAYFIYSGIRIIII